MTYSEIDGHSNRLANFLRQQGVTSETAVRICLLQSIDAYIALVAVLKTGGRYVQLNADFPGEQIRHKANEANLIAVITTTELGLQEDDVGTSLVFPDLWGKANAESSTDQSTHDKGRCCALRRLRQDKFYNNIIFHQKVFLLSRVLS